MGKVYKVVYSLTPVSQWEVHFDDEKIGYPAWDQHVAVSFAKDAAKKNRPSTILVHDRNGKEQKIIDYPADGKMTEKKIDAKEKGAYK